MNLRNKHAELNNQILIYIDALSEMTENSFKIDRKIVTMMEEIEKLKELQEQRGEKIRKVYKDLEKIKNAKSKLFEMKTYRIMDTSRSYKAKSENLITEEDVIIWAKDIALLETPGLVIENILQATAYLKSRGEYILPYN